MTSSSMDLVSRCDVLCCVHVNETMVLSSRWDRMVSWCTMEITWQSEQRHGRVSMQSFRYNSSPLVSYTVGWWHHHHHRLSSSHMRSLILWLGCDVALGRSPIYRPSWCCLLIDISFNVPSRMDVCITGQVDAGDVWKSRSTEIASAFISNVVTWCGGEHMRWNKLWELTPEV